MDGPKHARVDAAIDESSVAPFEAGETRQAAGPEPARATSTFRHACVLGMLTALGALGVDTYLPAFPAIAKGFDVQEDQVQLTLVSYFVALAVGQMFYGPLSDRIGRRIPLLVGFTLFVLASVAAAMSTSVEMLIVVRFVQGLGACAGMVIARAIVRDLRSGEEAARLFALMMLVLGVSPILAPLIGSLLLSYLPWQASFWFLAGAGLCCLGVITLLLEETHPPSRRTTGGLGEAFVTYGRLLRDRSFVLTVLIGGASQAVVFAYLAGSPFVYITLHEVPPTVYSLLFALNGIGLIGSAQFNVRLIRRWGTGPLVITASGVQLAAACALLVVALAGAHVSLIAICIFFCVAAQGLLGPTTAMLALEKNPHIAGSASAVMGTISFAFGAASSALVSILFNGTTVPFAAVIFGCAAAGLAAAVAVVGRREVEESATTGALAVSLVERR